MKNFLRYPTRVRGFMVEGAYKSMIGRRLKQTNARWQVGRLNEMALLCSVHYSDLWELCWKNIH